MSVFSLRILLFSLFCLLSPACYSQKTGVPSAQARSALVKIVTPRMEGTGFLMRKDGLLLTAYHVIAGVTQATATLANGKTYPILGIVKEDSRKDYALLKLEGDAFSNISIASTKPVRNQEVVMLGYSRGVLKARKGKITQISISSVQGKQVVVNTGIDFGFSGGPVLNAKGEAIALLTSAFMKERSASIEGDITVALSLEELLPLLKSTAPLVSLSTAATKYAGSAEADFDEAQQILYHSGSRLSGAENLTPSDAAKLAPVIQKLENAVAKREDYVEALLSLGHFYFRAGRAQEAAVRLEQALRYSPDDVASLLELGNVYATLERTYEAGKLFVKVTQLNPSLPQPYFNLGLLANNTGQFQQAIPFFKKAIQRRPRFTKAFMGLGQTYHKLQRYKEALTAYKRARVLEPDQYTVYLALARLHMDMKHPQEALIACQQGLRLNPNSPGTLALITVVYLSLGKQQKAIEHYYKLKRLAPKLAESLHSLLPEGTPR